MKSKAVPVLIAIVMALAMLAAAQENAPAPSQPQTQGPGMGQARRHRGGMRADPVARRMQMMSQRLNLTDEQKTKIQPILENEVQQAQAIRNDTSLTAEQKQAKFQELRQQTHSQIQPLLTPEQRAQAGQGPGQGNPQHRLDMLSQRLNLTDDQKAKLSPVFQSERQQMQALQQDTSLSPEQKKAKMQQIRQDTRKQVLGVLTPEQQQQLREMRGRYGRRGGRFGQGAPAQGAPPTSPNPGL